MPHCTNCGELVSQNSRFCGKCGETVKNSGNNGTPDRYTPPTPNPSEYKPPLPTPSNLYPMKWYIFLIYFYLIVSAAMLVFNGLDFLTGSYLGEAGDILYETIPKWKLVDVMAGIFYIAMGVYAIFIRQKLAKYEEDAPKAYISYLIADAVGSSLHFVLIFSFISDLNSRQIDMMLSGFGSMFILIIDLTIGEIMASKVYFEKRKDLFKF